ncbi:hypothetical protein ABND12_17945 [Paenibacillus larvae]
MAVNRKLNMLAIKAKDGCVESLWEIRYFFLNYIHDLSDKNWWTIGNEERFEANCFTRIDEAVRKYEPNRGNFYSQVIWRINGLLRQTQKRYYQRPVVVSLQYKINNEEDSPEIGELVVDSLAAVEDQVIRKDNVRRKIALLAKGDLRRTIILKEWASGETSDTNIARLLAQHCKGRTSSHHRFITRFRHKCREALVKNIQPIKRCG